MTVALLSGLALAGCGDSEQTPREVEFAVKVDDGQFSSGAPRSLGLYACKAGQSAVPAFLIDNEPLRPTADGTVFILDRTEPLAQESLLDIYLYAPYNASGLACAVDCDQTAAEALDRSDILLAAIDGVGSDKRSLTANFAHLASQVAVELVLPSGADFDPNEARITLLDRACEGTIDLTARAVTVSGRRGDVEANMLNARFDAATRTVTGIRAMLLPETLEAGCDFLTVAAGGESKVFRLAEPLTFEPGKLHLIRIDLTEGLSFDMTVSPWDDRFGEREIVIPNFYMFDLEGNRYDAVPIGDLLWTASNLRTACFNDATPIASLSSSQWAAHRDAPAFAYCNDDPDTASELGLLYNWESVATGKLCPEGWRVPTREEWLAMREVAGGEYEAGRMLKATSGWEDRDGVSKPEYQGVDRFGFRAVPTGYINDRGSFDHYKEGYGVNSATGWWSTTSDEYRLRGYAFQIYYMAPNLHEDLIYVNYGYSVRCVRAIDRQ